MNRRQRRQAQRHGRRGEALAIWWLRLHLYRICEVRYRTKTGEIDLIARRGKRLVFIEVKWRKSGASPYDVTPFQADRMVRTASMYLATHRQSNHQETRFDLILLGPWRWPRHIRAAFFSDHSGIRSIT